MYRKKDRSIQQQLQFITLEDLVPQDHILRKIDRAIDFSFIYDEVEGLYSPYDMGRPGIDPVSLFKIVFIQYLLGIRSMRQTIQEINVNVAYRWFIGYGLLEPVPHFSTFSKNYTRRFQGTPYSNTSSSTSWRKRSAPVSSMPAPYSSTARTSRRAPTKTKASKSK